MRSKSNDFDNSWKDSLDHFFESFIAFFFPKTYARIDWKRKYEFLDNEFRQVIEEAKLSKRLVDRLVKVWLKGGLELWVLIHIEIQNQRDKNFAERMYNYHNSIFRRYGKRIASMAILGDSNKDWKPSEFSYTNLDCGVRFFFPSVKLLDYNKQWSELEKSRNPFSVMVMAHLKMLAAGKDVTNRASLKLETTKDLLDRGFSDETAGHVLRFIDMVFYLPEMEEAIFRHTVIGYMKEKKMVNTMIPWEKVAYKDGLETGLKTGLEKGVVKGLLQKSQEAIIVVLTTRFDTVPQSCLRSIKKLSDINVLESLLRTAVKAESLAEFKKVLKEIKQ